MAGQRGLPRRQRAGEQRQRGAHAQPGDADEDERGEVAADRGPDPRRRAEQRGRSCRVRGENQLDGGVHAKRRAGAFGEGQANCK